MAVLTSARSAHVLGLLGNLMVLLGLDRGGLALLQCLAF